MPIHSTLLFHKTFSSLIRELQKIFHSPYLKINRDVNLVFLCGEGLRGDEQRISNRHVLVKYAEKHMQNYKFVLAEDVFRALIKDQRELLSDLLTLEEKMAYVVDCVLIILESIGAATELGAFSLHAELRKKLLLLNDNTHKDSNSFLIEGPIRLIEKHSMFGDTIYGDLGVINSFIPEIEDRLKKIPERTSFLLWTGEDVTPSKYILFVLCDLLRLIGPLSSKNIVTIMNLLIGGLTDELIYTLISIGIGVKFIEDKVHNGRKIFDISNSLSSEEPFYFFDKIEASHIRARFLSKHSKLIRPTVLYTQAYG